MRRPYFLVLLVLTISLFNASFVLADTSGTVSATVTPKLISVSVSPTSVSYGIMMLDGSGSPQGDPTIVATNNGNVNENLHIRGANATAVGGSGTWTLAASPGQNQYVHYYGVAPAYNYNALTTSTVLFGSGITPQGTSSFKLRIALPNTITGDYVQYTTTVTVQATE